MRLLFPDLSVARLTGLFDKTRLAWYERMQANQTAVDHYTAVLELVEVVRKLHPKIGTAKLYHLLKPAMREMNIMIGRDGLHNVLADNGLLVRGRRRKYVTTTNSRHAFQKYDNLFKDLKISAPLQAWVSDITYIRVSDSFAYLSLITDAYSRKIVGYHLHENLSHEGCLHALNLALDEHEHVSLKGMLHHSDRGLQYCCTFYVLALNKRDIVVSMTQDSVPTDNAIAERVNGILKTEYGLGERFTALQQAKDQVAGAVLLYNTKRPHASLDYMTPEEAHRKTGPLKKRWKQKKKPVPAPVE